jgi:hypothetical protein
VTGSRLALALALLACLMPGVAQARIVRLDVTHVE